MNSTPRPNQPERAIQAAVLRYCAYDARIAWARRMNTGATAFESHNAKGKKQRRFVRFAFAGCADIIGQLASGHFLAIEVKRPGRGPTDEQASFLADVNTAGGLGFIAHSIDDVKAALHTFAPKQQNAA